MPDFGFVGPSYEAPSIYQDDQECINFRPEIDPLKQPGQYGVIALYPTPGLVTKVTLNYAEVRGMRNVSGGQYLVVVCGGDVYVLNSTLTPVRIGALNTSSGIVGITDNSQNVYIVDGTYRYTWRISNPSSAQFIGSISGTTLTVTLMKSGTIATGQQLFGSGVVPETVITGLGTGTGGVGTYTINNTQTIASEVFDSAAVAAKVTGSISGTILTVTAVASGTIYPGQTIQGTGVTTGTIVTALGGSAAISYSITAAGTGYAVGDTITVTGGIYSQQTTYTVATIGGSGAVTGLTVVNYGVYTVNPGTPASTTTSGNGTGLTLTLTFGTGTGGTGTYVVSSSQTVSSTTLYALNFSVLPNSDGAFSGADVVDVVDNYFVYNRPNTQQWGSSNILSPISSQLAFSSKDGAPDNLVSMIVDHREVYLLGEASSEVWVDSGLFPFAFQRIPGTSTQHGIAAKFSVARLGNSFAYLSKNIRGDGQIMMMNGYIPTRISTHAVENSIEGAPISDARAWTYLIEGHEVYVISFPGLDLTWAYDIATGMWHKWLWVDNKNVFHRHRGNCHSHFQNMNLVGDWENGQIYMLDPNTYTDSGQEIRRVRRAPHLVSDFQRQFFSELQILFQPGVGLSGNIVGSTSPTNGVAGVGIAGFSIAGQSSLITQGANPQAMLRWSNDGGSTWSNEHWTSIGLQGAYKNRAIWRRLGQARDRVYEVVVTDPIKAVIVAANLKAEAGEN
ncbi:hypothetical protein UFOVP41_51 [uncultured Caudovirales phage]|uniref:Bacteriophage P22, Gp10, DNA-stabilising n=1 Tax=uncultured Caudovirales phage TaxID=2100421 RepID=A0A6J5KT72_9CAUD|nr:hypothetical protein UFOVP41_51 [uncultured Caudovirales phage]